MKANVVVLWETIFKPLPLLAFFEFSQQQTSVLLLLLDSNIAKLAMAYRRTFYCIFIQLI